MNRPSVLQVGGTLYWVILTRDPDTMVLKDADSTPTVAVRKNGASTADSVTVTKRSATTGIYDCSYNPAGEAEGDEFTIEESATVTGTTTAQATYTNSWEFAVLALERGTDSAALASGVNVTQISGSAVSTTTAQLGVNVVNAGGTAWGSGAITAAAISSNAITSAKIATDAIGSAQLAASAVGKVADGVWDEPYAGHTTAGSFGKLLDTIRKANLTIDGTVSNAITPTTLTFSSNVVATTSAYAHAVLLFVSGPLAGENSPIISYNSTNGVFVLEEPLTAAPSDGDEFVVIAGSHVHDVASIQSGLATTTQLTTVEGKIDAIDTVTDKLNTTVELDGSVYRFTTNALEQAPSGGGGGGNTIVVTPLVAQTPVRVVGTNIETFVGDLSDIDVSVFSGEDPVDLSALGNLEVCVQAKNGVDLDLVEMADLTISGTSNETISWTPNGPSVSDVGRFKWSLRIASNKQVIAYGAWIVVDAALSDAS